LQPDLSSHVYANFGVSMIRYSATRLLISLAAVFTGAACGGSRDSRVTPDSGGVKPSLEATSDSALMAKGLQLLYQTSDASGAAETFRAVLKQNPNHYGAHLQLAKALDLAGRPTEARPIWTDVLAAAVSSKDAATANTARVRLAQPDTVSQATMMAVGLNLLYAKNDPAAAAEKFRELLRVNPTHYGAHLQLAKALDRAGNPIESRPYWEKVLRMAEAVRDTTTANAARARLAKTP
jgi:Tfp pilus assembly protein PilF